MRFIIVTGMSGAGKSSALKMLEDMGYYCVDNLPIQLLKSFVDLSDRQEFKRQRVVVGIDIRSGETLSLLSDILSELEQDGKKVVLPADTPVSMNLWGLTPDIFDILKEEYKKFLSSANLMKDEFFIPSVISKALEEGKATVRVFRNADKWYGITYREDLGEVKEAIGGYIHDGLYEGI